MTPTLDGIEEVGTIEYPAADAVLCLEVPDAVWIVLEGKLDIFVAMRSAQQDLGSRHHFLRVEEGQAVFGMECVQGDIAIFAIVAPGTKLLKTTLMQVQSRIEHKSDFTKDLLENWIDAVGTRLCTRKASSSFLYAYPGTLLEVGEESRAVLAPEGIVWVTHSRGASYPLSDHRLAVLNGESYFPLSRDTWLQADAGSTLQGVSTFELSSTDPKWFALKQFHAFALSLLSIERREALATEQTGIQSRAKSDARVVENALLRLTTPIRKSRSKINSQGHTANQLFIALQAVANEMGITLSSPVEILRGDALPDPITTIAKASGVRVRRVVLRGQWWKDLNGPLACFTDGGMKPVAVLTKSTSRKEVYDPSTDTVVLLNKDMASGFSPIAYTFYRPFPRKALNAVDLLRFGLSRCYSEVILIVGVGVATGALAVITPIATGVIFDSIIPSADRDQLIQMAIFLLVVAIVSWLFLFARGIATLRVQSKMDAMLQSAVWDRLLGLPVSFFRDYSSGDLAERSMGISQIRDVMTGSALNALLSGIFSVFTLALLFYYSVILAITAVILVLAVCATTLITGFFQVRYRRGILRISGGLSSKLLQLFTGIAKLKVSGTEGRAFAAWSSDFTEQVEATVGARRIANGLIVFNSVVPVISFIAIFYANAYLMGTPAEHGQLSTGQFIAFLTAFGQLLAAGLSVSSTVLSVASIVPFYERAKPILQAIPEVAGVKSHPGSLSGEIEVSHVNFAYKADTPLVLRDLTLKIKAGQSVAFVGSSGCGKSTLLRLLLGFEVPSSGSVYFDGQDISGLDIQAVRRQFGVVLQTSRPVSGSIFDNIVGSAPLSVDDAWEACRMSGLEEDIRRMPMGLHTCISDGGGGLSGGQRQRLMIARAIVNRPRILLFDEATSALDNHTQAIVTRSISRLQATRIIVAHRLSTVVGVDKIFVFDKGSIVECGSYHELMELGGMFSQIAKRQLT